MEPDTVVSPISMSTFLPTAFAASEPVSSEVSFEKLELMFVICSRLENCAIWAMNWVSCIGAVGSWWDSCAMRSWRKSSLPSSVLEGFPAFMRLVECGRPPCGSSPFRARSVRCSVPRIPPGPYSVSLHPIPCDSREKIDGRSPSRPGRGGERPAARSAIASRRARCLFGEEGPGRLVPAAPSALPLTLPYRYLEGEARVSKPSRRKASASSFMLRSKAVLASSDSTTIFPLICVVG